jgi:hypothetical protein
MEVLVEGRSARRTPLLLVDPIVEQDGVAVPAS